MKRIFSLLTLFLALSFVANAKDLTKAQRELRDEIFKFVKSNGYSPEVDEDGDISFRYNEYNYLIEISEVDTDIMYLTLSLSFKYNNDFNAENINMHANEINKYRCVKLVPYTSGFAIQQDLYLTEASTFNYSFQRTISIMESALTELQELIEKGTPETPVATPSGPSAELSDITLEHGVTKNGTRGMNIHVKCTIRNMVNKEGTCIAYFYNADGNALKDVNGKYNTVSGKVCCTQKYTPMMQVTEYTDICLFMPYTELHQSSGNHNLKLFVSIFDNNGNEMVQSNWIEFKYNR